MSLGGVDFLGEDPIELAERLESLAQDIRSLATGASIGELLAEAPVMTGPRVHARPRPALVGAIANHPVLGDNDHCITSEIFALGADRSWARTMSRFYRLERKRTS